MSTEDRDLTNRELGDLLIDALAGAAEREEKPPRCPDDSEWTCDRCDTLLGVVDAIDGTIRRKYRDDLAYVNLGQGGKITVPCRKCAHPNVITSEHIQALKEAVLRKAADG